MNANFGEELVYWYLRFNGFFTLNNFVLHHNSSGRASDTDLLAVRFPYVYEETGGREDDWDINLFSQIDQSKIIGLICEVKTGLNFNSNEIFKDYNLYKAIGRFGFVDNLNERHTELIHSASISVENYQIYKVLISRKREASRSDCIHLRLFDVKKFLNQRIQKYADRKYGDRMFFNSSLMQYLIWEEHLKKMNGSLM